MTENERLIATIGSRTTSDPMVAFLYELLRDHVQPGVMQQVMQNSRQPFDASDDTWVLSNGYLAKYAEYVAESLKM